MNSRHHRRSILCTPATATARYSRAHRSQADIGLVDLEDSVAPASKQHARTAAERYFTADDRREHVLALRINTPARLDGLRDLLAAADYARRPDIVLIPKVESAREVELVAAVLSESGTPPQIWALIETPRAISEIDDIGRAPHLGGLAFGAADYARATGAEVAWEPLMFARAAIVTAAARRDVPSIDSPYFDLDDLDGLRRESRLSRALGFTGKVAIHPRQVPVINTAFSPTAGELADARAIVAAAENAHDEVTAVGSRMVGTPFFHAARALLDEFDTAPAHHDDAASTQGAQQ